jgi:hypothetical protein
MVDVKRCALCMLGNVKTQGNDAVFIFQYPLHLMLNIMHRTRGVEVTAVLPTGRHAIELYETSKATCNAPWHNLSPFSISRLKYLIELDKR